MRKLSRKPLVKKKKLVESLVPCTRILDGRLPKYRKFGRGERNIYFIFKKYILNYYIILKINEVK